MKLFSTTKTINFSAALPSSKSICNRVLLIRALCERNFEIANLSDCDDTQAMLSALSSSNSEINIGAAGTAMRFLTAFFSLGEKEIILTGTERMKQRPIKILVDALRQVGAKIEYLENDGFPPLKISGANLTGGEIALRGDVSSQYISALLMIAPKMAGGLRLKLLGQIASRPYIEMTIALMQLFGAKVSWLGDTIRVEQGSYQAQNFRVEADFSAASYWYEILSLAENGEIFLPDLKENSLQGDKKVAEFFAPLGVETHFSEQGVILKKTERKTDFLELDFSAQPDLAQTLVVTCALLGVHFHFTGLESLKIKETDRLAALRHELKCLGFEISQQGEGTLFWRGETVPPKENHVISTYHDHRMAMAFAPAALRFPIEIANPEVVSKSYPNFWQEIAKAGFSLA